MEKLQIIKEQEVLGKLFRIYGDFENPLFLAKDVAEWIEYSQREDGSYQIGQMLKSVDDNEKIFTVNNLNGKEMWFLTEDGFYEILMQSRKPIAKEFKKEVKGILRDIRRHGVYATDDVIGQVLNNPDFGIQLLSELKQEREEKRKLEQKIETDKPKVLFAEAVSTAKTSILIRELAKMMCQNGIAIGEKRLFQWLRENGYLVKQKGTDRNSPTQRSMECGLFEVKETVVIHSDGKITINKTTKVTGKGQLYFMNKILNKSALCSEKTER